MWALISSMTMCANFLVLYIHKKTTINKLLIPFQPWKPLPPPPAAATGPQSLHMCIPGCPCLLMLFYLFLPEDTGALPCNKILVHAPRPSWEVTLCRIPYPYSLAHPNHIGLSILCTPKSHGIWEHWPCTSSSRLEHIWESNGELLIINTRE